MNSHMNSILIRYTSIAIITLLVIYPVLFNHDRLLAYGLDIIEHFQFFDNRP